MSNKNLTYDFITDHPIASLGIFAGVVSLLSSVSDMSSKQRYEIQEREARKKALRNQFMRENPYNISDYLSDSEVHYFFCHYAYGCKPEDITKVTKKGLIQMWNNKRRDWFGVPVGGYKLPDDKEAQNDCLEDMVHKFRKSKYLQRIKDACWTLYLEFVDEQLILSGAF